MSKLKTGEEVIQAITKSGNADEILTAMTMPKTFADDREYYTEDEPKAKGEEATKSSTALYSIKYQVNERIEHVPTYASDPTGGVVETGGSEERRTYTLSTYAQPDAEAAKRVASAIIKHDRIDILEKMTPDQIRDFDVYEQTKDSPQLHKACVQRCSDNELIEKKEYEALKSRAGNKGTLDAVLKYYKDHRDTKQNPIPPEVKTLVDELSKTTKAAPECIKSYEIATDRFPNLLQNTSALMKEEAKAGQYKTSTTSLEKQLNQLYGPEANELSRDQVLKDLVKNVGEKGLLTDKELGRHEREWRNHHSWSEESNEMKQVRDLTMNLVYLTGGELKVADAATLSNTIRSITKASTFEKAVDSVRSWMSEHLPKAAKAFGVKQTRVEKAADAIRNTLQRSQKTGHVAKPTTPQSSKSQQLGM